MATAYLSLGSNIEPEHYLQVAVASLRHQFGDVLLSSVYRTPAVGFEGEDFLNAAARIYTDIGPLALNSWLHSLENTCARDRAAPRFSSRTLDIDLLLYDDVILRGPGNLQLPRTELATQDFVLLPMLDIAPDIIHPVIGTSLRVIYMQLPNKSTLNKVAIDFVRADS